MTLLNFSFHYHRIKQNKPDNKVILNMVAMQLEKLPTCMTNVSAAILSLSVPEDNTVFNHWTSDLPFSFSLTGGGDDGTARGGRDDGTVWGGGEDEGSGLGKRRE